MDKPSIEQLELIALRNERDRLVAAFDRFIGHCMDRRKNPLQPDMAALREARANLPGRCKNSFGEGGAHG